MANTFVAAGAIAGFLGVAFGAFGAHALKSRVAPDLLAIFEIGVRYQMYHALGLVLTGLLASSKPSPLLSGAGWSMAGGIVVFSGSLYLLALTDTRWLGAITPLGGTLFLAGWVMLALAALRM